MSTTDEARRVIVAAAEAHRQTLPLRVRIMIPPHTMRRVQWAVFVARQNRLVSGDVLAAAGYREAR